MDDKEALRVKWDEEWELSERLAVALGWAQPNGYAWRAPPGWGESVAEDFEHPLFARDLRACAEAEAEIARRGLRAQYLDALSRAVGWGKNFVEMSQWGKLTHIGAKDLDHIWDMLAAPPDMRVRAMLKVLEG